MKRIRSICLSFVLAIGAVLSVFGLSGCGTSVEDVAKSYSMLTEAYEKNQTIFSQGSFDDVGLNTKYMVNYCTKIDSYINAKNETYVELKSKYNIMLAISNDYIDNYMEYFLGYDNKNLGSDAKNEMKVLCKNLEAYAKEIKEFASARRNMLNYFESNGPTLVDGELTSLRTFKRAYGELVEKSLAVSTSLANSISKTRLFTLLKQTTTQKEDIDVVKDYVSAKLLPIYSNMIVTELENKFDWDDYKSVGDGERISKLLADITAQFAEYKDYFISNSSAVNLTKFSNVGMEKFLEVVDNFFTEVEFYFDALEKIDFKTLAIEFDNNLEKYSSKNNVLAKQYLEKLEQFVGNTLPNFETYVKNSISL